VEACGGALGWGRGEFITTYQELRGEQDDQALSLWPVYSVLLGLLRREPVLESTVGRLLERLTISHKVRDEVSAPDWPRTPRALSGELRRYAPNLRRLGVEVTWLNKGSDGRRVQVRKTAAGPTEPPAHHLKRSP
jgi:hypothetical protein